MDNCIIRGDIFYVYLSTENCTIFQSKTGPVETKKLIAL